MELDADEHIARAKSFWTAERIVIMLMFIIGFILGAVFAVKYLDKNILEKSAADLNSLALEKQRSDERNDFLYKCLVDNSIEPATCGAELAPQGEYIDPYYYDN